MNAFVERIKGRNGALVALGFVSALVIFLLVLAIGALFEWAEGDTTDSLRQLAVYQAEIDERPGVETRLKQAVGQASTSPGLLQASSTALAQAALESALKDIAKQSGADVRSSEILPASRSQDFEAVAVQSDLSVPMSRLRDLIYAIETRTPYFFIDHTNIVAQQNWEPDSNTAKDPTLEVRWTVTAYRWAGAQ
jgi:hypothetical protein